MALDQGLGIMVWSRYFGGLLSGKFDLERREGRRRAPIGLDAARWIARRQKLRVRDAADRGRAWCSVARVAHRA